MNPARRKWLLLVAVFVLMLAPAFLFIYWPSYKLHRDAEELIGEPEASVIAKLGPPSAVLTASEIAARPTEPWWGSGWHPAPTRPVTNKVLLYYVHTAGALVYVGPGGRVEHVHLVAT